MVHKKYFLLLFLFFISFQIQAQEFRGAWISTVFNKDWPSRSGLSTEEQQAELIRILDLHQKNGLNAVIFQVRTASDALYESELEPWSQWLSGKQGEAPDPYYDPLQFVIEEAHKRNMELHAWLNPYRAEINKGKKASVASQISQTHPEWCIAYGIRNYLDPGIPEVRAYITNVVKDIVLRYDVDGIHFDDYFYPYKRKGESFGDSRSYKKYGKDFNRKADWRRDNVNKIVEMLHDSIKAYKPKVKFGISPFGIWRNKREDERGSDTNGMTNYDGLYADVLHWLEQGWIDYAMPQLYWPIGHKAADFEVLSEWWAKNAYDRHIYAGLGLYNSGKKAKEELWRQSDQIRRQIEMTRQLDSIQGVCFFSSTSFFDNPFGVNELLQQELFSQFATAPSMPWKEEPVAVVDTKPTVETPADTIKEDVITEVALAKPQSFRISRSKNTLLFAWEYPNLTDSTRFKVYRFRGKKVGKIEDGELYAVTRNTSIMIKRKPRVWFRKRYSFFVVATEGLKNSEPSNKAKTKLKKNEAGPLLNPSVQLY